MARDEKNPKASTPQAPRANWIFPEEMPAPQVANNFHFTWVGSAVQMVVGYTDIRQFIGLTEDNIHDIRVEVSNRFVIPIESFAMLLENIDSIVRGMKNAGLQLDQMRPTARDDQSQRNAGK